MTPFISTVQKGTHFEIRSLELLQKHLSMSLRKVGGKSDGGVDLMGWWWVPLLSSSSSPRPTSSSDGITGRESDGESDVRRRRVRVFGQCKAEVKKLGPNYVREMEGVLHRYIHPVGSSQSTLLASPTVALLISQSSFTRSAILRAISSPIPFFLLHLPDERKPSQTSNGIKVDDEDVDEIGAAIWNPALGGPNGVFGGEIDVRWERSSTGGSVGRPGLWWKGTRLKNWLPDEFGGDWDEQLNSEK
jgi:hypothetical protein